MNVEKQLFLEPVTKTYFESTVNELLDIEESAYKRWVENPDYDPIADIGLICDEIGIPKESCVAYYKKYGGFGWWNIPVTFELLLALADDGRPCHIIYFV